MELKAGGQRRERLENFRAAIIAQAELVADELAGEMVDLEIPENAQIQLASNETGAWIDAKLWVDANLVGFPWGDEVANLPSAEELAEALRALIKQSPPIMPITSLKEPMAVLARYQGKRSWMDVKL